MQSIRTHIRDEYGISQGSTNSDYWIGLRQHCMNCPYEWSDLSPLDYENWQKGEPDYQNNENCVEAYERDTLHGLPMTSMTWNDEGCNSGQRWICQAYLDNFHSPTDPWLPVGTDPDSLGCQKGWQKFSP